ncbi:PAS domain S-box protein [Halorubrum sp. HHNYT27]|uniref:PAS domain S-box protein n=1 Tax=Halorubrum sp. HHNYT27 TaxID=3402275 RepID=UPI003EB9F9F1
MDESMLEMHYSRLDQLKEESTPVFLPYLLVSTSTDTHPNDQAVWDLVDEIISIPTEKRTLSHRLVNLLERRELTTNLSAELEQQRNLFRNIFESSNDAVFIIDPESEEIRECNPQACDLLGYTRDELRSSSPEVIHPDEKSEFRAFVTNVIENGRGYTTALTCHTKDGEQLEAEISASAFQIHGRSHVLASVRDITTRYEQRQVLKGLHDVTTELMRAPTKPEIAEVTITAAKQVFEYDIAGVRLLNDESASETLELVAATNETYDLLDATSTVYKRGESVVGGVFDEQEPTILDDIQSSETPFEYGPIRSVMCFPLDEHGVVSIGATESAAFDGMDAELTSILAANTTAALTRAQREQALSEQTEYFSSLFENATDAIADVTFEEDAPCIQDVNSEFERVFGYESANIRGTSLTDLVVPPSEEAASQSLIARAFTGGSTVETEGRRETATGRRDFLIRVVPIQQNGESLGAYVVYTDITEQKRRDQQLQVLNRVLRHNIRNKLNVVRGVVEWSLDNERDVPTSLAKNGLDAVDELLNLSETARTLSKGTNPKQNLEPVPIANLIEQPVTSLREHYPNADISITIETEEWVAGTVQVDRALKELCENAIKHSNQATPSVSITVEPAEDGTGWVTITVEDNGPGIPEEQQAVLREGKETQLQHGNGLGLWAVHWIVTIAGGDLRLLNDDGQGATVILNLPTVGANYGLQNHPETQI